MTNKVLIMVAFAVLGGCIGVFWTPTISEVKSSAVSRCSERGNSSTPPAHGLGKAAIGVEQYADKQDLYLDVPALAATGNEPLTFSQRGNSPVIQNRKTAPTLNRIASECYGSFDTQEQYSHPGRASHALIFGNEQGQSKVTKMRVVTAQLASTTATNNSNAPGSIVDSVTPRSDASEQYATTQTTPVFSSHTGTLPFQTYGNKSPDEPNIGGIVGGASCWITYAPTEKGTLFLDTIGSSFDTLLGVFMDNGSHSGFSSLVQLAWDDDSGGSKTSALHLPVLSRLRYYIMVDGKVGAFGMVKLHYSLKKAP